MKTYGIRQEMVEKVMATLDRRAFVGEPFVVMRASISKAMKDLGVSTAGMRVSLMVAEIVQRWNLVPAAPLKKPAVPKLPKKRAHITEDAQLSLRQQAALLAPMLEKLALQSLTKNVSPPLSLEDFQEQVRLALLEYGGSYPTQHTLEALIQWLDDHDYLFIEANTVQVIAIPISLPEPPPD